MSYPWQCILSNAGPDPALFSPDSAGFQAATFATGPLSALVEALVARPDAAYATHVPLSVLQKGAVALVSLAGALADPRRGDLVAAAGETTAIPLLPMLRDRMLRSEEGRLILAEKPLVTVGEEQGGGWQGRGRGRGQGGAEIGRAHV